MKAVKYKIILWVVGVIVVLALGYFLGSLISGVDLNRHPISNSSSEQALVTKVFVAVIFKSKQNNFPVSPEVIYTNKIVRISGMISQYQGKPEVILENVSQLEMGANID